MLRGGLIGGVLGIIIVHRRVTEEEIIGERCEEGDWGQAFQAERRARANLLRLGRSPWRGRGGASVAVAGKAGGEEEEPVRSQTQREAETAHGCPCWPMELGLGFGPI